MNLQLNGATFNSSNHQSPSSMSRLDSLLVSGDWLNQYQEVIQTSLLNPPLKKTKTSLLKPTSDHCPILLDLNCEKWGLSSFRFELMWLEENHFPATSLDWWNDSRVDGCAGFRLAKKLKLLKDKIKERARIYFRDVGMVKANTLEERRTSSVW